MNPTSVQTFNLPQVGAGQAPNIIASAGKTPVRVVIKNIGAAVVNVGMATQAVQGPEGVSGDSWQIMPSEVDVFVLAPGQRFYANSAAPAGRVCVTVSDALPLV